MDVCVADAEAAVVVNADNGFNEPVTSASRDESRAHMPSPNLKYNETYAGLGHERNQS